MSEWKEYKLDELADITSSKRIFYSEYVSQGIPFYRSKEIIDIHNRREIKTELFISENRFNEIKEKFGVPEKDDILLTSVGSLGIPYLVKENDVFYFKDGNLTWFRRINKSRIDVTFLMTWLNSKVGKQKLDEVTIGSTQSALTISGLKTIEITLPPVPEQSAIATVLTSLDDKINLLHLQNATLEAMAEILFRKWFVEEAMEDWEEKKLGDILTITSSKRIFYSEYVSSGIPFYRSKEIIELRNTGSTNSELCISEERFDEINNRFGSPKEGDILMTSVGTLGVAYRVKKSDKFYFKDGNLTWFKDFNLLPSSIIYLWLISRIGQEELASITIGSTQEALTIEGLKSISFKIPPKEKIKEYAVEFETIISKIESNQIQICTLTALRDTLLPKLMSGEVRVERPVL